LKIVLILFLSLQLLFSNSCDKKSFKIAIDVGHSFKRVGAVSASGKSEYLFNYRLANEFNKALKNNGFKNILFINKEKKELPLLKRCDLANRNNANLFISLHHDSVQEKYLSYEKVNGKKRHFSNKFSGYSIFYSNKNPKEKESISFAKILADELLEKGFTPTSHHAEKIKGENRDLIDKKRGVYNFPDLIVVKRTNMPAVLFEAGIIVNKKEEKNLEKREYRKKIIDSLINSVESFCVKNKN